MSLQRDVTTSTITPGWQRIVSAIGRQQTVQSSMSDCSAWEVSTWIGKTSPQCGHVISVSAINSIFEAVEAGVPPAILFQSTRHGCHHKKKHTMPPRAFLVAGP